MKFFLSLMMVIVAGLSCTSGDQSTLNEIHKYEYRREPSPEKFIPWLNSSDAQVRLTAVTALGRIQDTSAITWVSNRLNDESRKVREAAAFALGQFFSPAAQQEILENLGSRKTVAVKSRLLEALGKCGTEKSFKSLQGYLQSEEPAYQQAAALSCGILAYRGFPPYPLGGTLSDLYSLSKDPEVRWHSMYGLYRLGSPTDVRALTGALNSVSSPDRFFALKGLTVIAALLNSPEFRDYKAFESTREIYRRFHSADFREALDELIQDSEWYVKVADLQLIATLKDPELWEAVKSGMKENGPHVRTAALQAASAYNTPEAKTLLLREYQQSGDWRKKGEALQALAAVNPAEAMKMAKKNIAGVEWPRNYYLIKTLESVNNGSADRLLLELLESQNPAQVSMVLEALRRSDQVPVNTFLQKLNMKDPAVTTIVAYKMAELKSEPAVSPLIESYRYFQAPKDFEPMLAIITALDSIGSPKADDFFAQNLDNRFPPVRQAARRALERSTGKKYPLSPAEKQSLTRHDFPEISPDSHPQVKFYTTKGEFTIELYPEEAPVTVANFVQLVKTDFYDGIYFHRVVPAFVVQAGDPRGDGWGGPGYAIPCEYNDIRYERGVVGMAHAGKDTGGSQFFITHTPQPHLNGRHTAFGRVISGMEIVDSIQMYDKIENAELIN